jgi:L-threonylcarbamoyladenylate synthase
MIVPAYAPDHSTALSPPALDLAVRAIRAGRLVGLPTETVYGLAADADQSDAVAQIYAAKGRPSNHPLIVHVSAHDGGMSGVAHYAEKVPAFAQQLMAAFWPGPLTLILPRRAGVASAAAAGQSSIALRCPDHPVAQALLAALRHSDPAGPPVWGLAAPSANRFGRVSPTLAAHVYSEFGETLAGGLLILDGGPCALGIESTIVDCTRGAPVVLRPGSLGRAQLEAACGQVVRSTESAASPSKSGSTSMSDTSDTAQPPAPRAPGTLASHYAPRARVQLMDVAALQAALDRLGTPAPHAPVVREGRSMPPVVAVYARSPLRNTLSQAVLWPMPRDAAAAAHALFAALRALDDLGVEQIWVEAPPDAAAWDGVRDRLQRASA